MRLNHLIVDLDHTCDKYDVTGDEAKGYLHIELQRVAHHSFNIVEAECRVCGAEIDQDSLLGILQQAGVRLVADLEKVSFTCVEEAR